MPIHLHDLDILPEVQGRHSAVIVACNMCAGASLAMRENKPFLQFFKSLFKSPPLERHIRKLKAQLAEKGVRAEHFRGGIVQQFFLCLWTARQRRKLRDFSKDYEAAIVLGCDSATETVLDSVSGTDCKVIAAMSVAGVMNTKPKFRFPFNISFEESDLVPMCDHHCKQSRKQEHRG